MGAGGEGDSAERGDEWERVERETVHEREGEWEWVERETVRERDGEWEQVERETVLRGRVSGSGWSGRQS